MSASADDRCRVAGCRVQDGEATRATAYVTESASLQIPISLVLDFLLI